MQLKAAICAVKLHMQFSGCEVCPRCWSEICLTSPGYSNTLKTLKNFGFSLSFSLGECLLGSQHGLNAIAIDK